MEEVNYRNGDIVNADTINEALNTAIRLGKPIDNSEADNVGIAELIILPNGRLKAKNLKGKEGKEGKEGESISNIVSEEPIYSDTTTTTPIKIVTNRGNIINFNIITHNGKNGKDGSTILDIVSEEPIYSDTTTTTPIKIVTNRGTYLFDITAYNGTGKIEIGNQGQSDDTLYVASIDDGETIELDNEELANNSYEGRKMVVLPNTYGQVTKHPFYKDKGIIPYKYMKGYLNGSSFSDKWAEYKKLENGNFYIYYTMGREKWNKILNYDDSIYDKFNKWFNIYSSIYANIFLYSFSSELVNLNIELHKDDIYYKSYVYINNNENAIIKRIVISEYSIEYEISSNDWEQCGISLSQYTKPDTMPYVGGNNKIVTIRNLPVRYYDSSIRNYNQTTGQNTYGSWLKYHYNFEKTNEKGEFEGQIIPNGDILKVWDKDKGWRILSVPNINIKSNIENNYPIENIIQYYSSNDINELMNKNFNINPITINDGYLISAQPKYVEDLFLSGEEITMEQFIDIFNNLEYIFEYHNEGSYRQSSLIFNIENNYLLLDKPFEIVIEYQYTSQDNKQINKKETILYDSLNNKYSKYIHNTNYNININIYDLYDMLLQQEINNPTHRILGEISISPNSNYLPPISIDSIKISYAENSGIYYSTNKLSYNISEKILTNKICEIFNVLVGKTEIPMLMRNRNIQRKTLKQWLEDTIYARYKRIK